MKLQFKVQQYQTDAVDAVVETFAGTVKGLAGSTAYLYLDAIEIAKGAKPRARVEIEVQTASGIKRQVKRLDMGANLHDLQRDRGIRTLGQQTLGIKGVSRFGCSWPVTAAPRARPQPGAEAHLCRGQ